MSTTKKIKLRLPDEIRLPVLMIAPQRVIHDANARTLSGEVNRKPRVLFSTITIETRGAEVELETDAQNPEKAMLVVGFCDPNGRWQFSDQDGGEITWHSVVTEYLALFGTKETPPERPLSDTDAFLDQLTEDTDDQVVAELTLARRTGPVTQRHHMEQLAQPTLEIAEGNAGSGRIEITARGTGHVINPGDKK